MHTQLSPAPRERARLEPSPRADAARPRSRLVGVLAAATIACCAAALAGCKDDGKASADKARANVASLVALAESDVAELERGMPEGAKRLATLFEGGKDATQDAPAARSALKRLRREVPDLVVAKSTFFAVADAKGIAIRNDLEQDVMAGKDLVKTFPDLAKTSAGTFVTTTGAFPGLAELPEPDRDFIAAAPIALSDGKVAGMLVSGWSYRYFARHLQETLTKEIRQAAAADPNAKAPILYVGVFDETGVFMAPLTPPVNRQALVAEGLVAKTAAGPMSAPLVVTERAFGYAAARVPKLGPTVGVVVLRSEI